MFTTTNNETITPINIKGDSYQASRFPSTLASSPELGVSIDFVVGALSVGLKIFNIFLPPYFLKKDGTIL